MDSRTNKISLKNRLGILHGGTVASMGVLCSVIPPASSHLIFFDSGLRRLSGRSIQRPFCNGVSTDLNVTYINPGGRIGDTVRAEVTCDKFGKTLAYTSIRFTNDKDQLIARGSHTK